MASSKELRHRSALIVYGSETGNAQDVAEELGRLFERLHFSPRVAELNSISIGQLLQYTVVVFTISTTGQGDLPANSRAFWKSIRSVRLRAGCLNDVTFTSFGLGDSSYPKFNWAHRKLYSRIVQLGGQPLCERGEADEQHPEGVDGCFLPWYLKLKRTLLESYPLPEGISPVPDDVFLEPKSKLVLTDPSSKLHSPTQPEMKTNGENAPSSAEKHDAITADSAVGAPDDLIPIPGTISAQLVQNTRVTPKNHWQDVRQLVFSTAPIEYGPGDVLTIFPKNFPEDAESFINLMGWTSIADLPVEFTPSKSGADSFLYPLPPVQHPLPHPKFTIRTLLLHYLDITAIPRRSFFAAIAHFTNDETQKERLIEFTNPELVDELYDYTTRPRRSILEVLQEFDTVKVPWEWIASVIPSIRGRQFSIASGGDLKMDSAGNGRVELLVAIVEYRTVIKKIRRGLCTRYLAALAPGTKLNVKLVKGGLTIPPEKPLVLVGPGTGIAPLRSILLERSRSLSSLGGAQANHMLAYGGRNRAADFFFENEWSAMKNTISLEVLTAFSRDQVAKFYVQDVLRSQSRDVYALLKDGVLIISGSSGKMPQAVREAIIEIFQKEANMQRHDAEAHLVMMEKTGRYQQETW